MRAVPVRNRLSIGILAAGLLVGAAAGAVIGAQQPAVYRATATVFVATAQSASVGEQAPVPGVLGQGGAARGYVDMATTPFLLNRVISELGLRASADALARRMHVANPTGTVLLSIGVDDARPTEAVRIADAVARAEVDVASSFPPAGSDGIGLTLVRPSAGTVQQVAPDVPLDTVLGAALGLLAAAAVLLMRHRDALRRHWRNWIRPSPPKAASMFG